MIAFPNFPKYHGCGRFFRFLPRLRLVTNYENVGTRYERKTLSLEFVWPGGTTPDPGSTSPDSKTPN